MSLRESTGGIISPFVRRESLEFPLETSLVSRAEFFADLKGAWRTVKEQGQLSRLMELQRSRAISTSIAFAHDWAVILFSVWLVAAVSVWWLPLSLLLIGSRHRALSNLIHDSSHGNLFKSRAVNDLVTNVLAALPMQDTVRSYRGFHGRHHANLGTLTEDPDAVTHLNYGFNDLKPPGGTFLTSYLSLILLKASWRDSMLGGFADLRAGEKIKVAVWWALAVTALASVGGLRLVGIYLALWFGARATTYHGIRLFAEFLDHAGLQATSVVNFSRTLPHFGIMPWLSHPHQDTYHLVHHLAPNVPHYNLKAASELFQKDPKYRAAHHCDAYFAFGNHRAVDCWSGRCSAT